MDRSRLIRAFHAFRDDCIHSSPSPLYASLTDEIVKDDELLGLCEYIRPGQPAPNMLLGAVHYLLLKNVHHPLSNYYASITPYVKDVKDAFPLFKKFCSLYREEIISLLQTKLVQTNEVRRTAYLYPSFSYIYSQTRKPLAIIELGTSAGLQLLWDRYSYCYGGTEHFGNSQSSVTITSQIIGTNKPYLSKVSPPVSNRIGLDLHINDVTNDEDYSWLMALIWPEHHKRRELFKGAAEMVAKTDLELIEGDGIQMIPEIASHIPHSSILCIFHTHVANQFSEKQKQQLLTNVQKIGNHRNIYHLYNNMWDGDLHIDAMINGKFKQNVVGKINNHGSWFTWKLPGK